MGQEILTLSGTPDFTPFGEFMISPIYPSKDYVHGLMTPVCLPGLVLTALSWTYFIITIQDKDFLLTSRQ